MTSFTETACIYIDFIDLNRLLVPAAGCVDVFNWYRQSSFLLLSNFKSLPIYILIIDSSCFFCLQVDA